jgi:nucleotide-binding universal stress UspA family protein
MKLPRSIVVATDFSETSNAAIDYAVTFAALTGGSVTIVHAYEIPFLGVPDLTLIASGDVLGRIEDAAHASLRACAATHRSRGVALHTVLRQGSAYVQINAVADDVNADLIVIGTHGRRGVARMLIGSVAENVIRTATRPVLTIHAPRVVRSTSDAKPVATPP